MIARFNFTPVLGWSASRYDKFRICKRQYYYDYYLKYDNDYPEYRIRALKEMTSIPLSIGIITHKVIKVLLKRLIKSEVTIDRQRFLDFARRETEKYCKQHTFSEVYYDEIDQINTTELFDVIKENLMNLLNSDRFLWIKEKAIGNKDNWIIEPPGYGECRLDSLKAYCKVDFLFPVDNKVYIIDWKTGKKNEEKHTKQLLGYVSWASYHLKKDPEIIIPIIAYLQPSYQERRARFNEYDIQDFKIEVSEATEEMYSFCKDIEENIPLDKGKFKKTGNSRICEYCNYRELCE